MEIFESELGSQQRCWKVRLKQAGRLVFQWRATTSLEPMAYQSFSAAVSASLPWMSRAFKTLRLHLEYLLRYMSVELYIILYLVCNFRHMAWSIDAVIVSCLPTCFITFNHLQLLVYGILPLVEKIWALATWGRVPSLKDPLSYYVCTYVGGCGLPGLVLHTTTSEAGACAAHVDAVS